LRHLEAKVTARTKDMARVSADLVDDAEALILSFGITSRASLQAVRDGRAAGRRLSFLGVQSLFLIPIDEIRAAARGAKRVIVAEENMNGLYRRALGGALPGLELAGVNKLGGMIRPAEILEAL